MYNDCSKCHGAGEVICMKCHKAEVEELKAQNRTLQEELDGVLHSSQSKMAELEAQVVELHTVAKLRYTYIQGCQKREKDLEAQVAFQKKVVAIQEQAIADAVSTLRLDPTKRTCYNVAHDLEECWVLANEQAKAKEQGGFATMLNDEQIKEAIGGE